MIREINTAEIISTVKEMCIEANHFLSEDMDSALKKATAEEKSELGQKILNQLQDNLKIAGEESETGLFLASCSDDGTYDMDSSTWQTLGMENIVDNTNTKILFNIPQSIPAGSYRLILKTAYGSGKRINKTVRTGVYSEKIKLE